MMSPLMSPAIAAGDETDDHRGPGRIARATSVSPHTTAVSPMIEPTERSMPPVAMTAVMPSAMMPMNEKLRVMLIEIVGRGE